MDKFIEKLSEVSVHFDNNDIDLGYRKLIDCVLDTKNIQLYKHVVKIEVWKESQTVKNSEVKALYEELLDLVSLEKVNESTASDILLQAKNISKSYGRNKFTLTDINLELKKGQIIGLVGENGNGKTTLLRILAKELYSDSGDIQFNLRKKYNSTFNLRTKLTYVPQRTPKWYGSLLNNLKYCASSYGIKGEMNEYYVYMMIIRFGLWKYRNLKWEELSSGYKMRFELARTFLRAPEILFLDEPLANLDVVAQQLILEDLKNMARSISNPLGIILSSQQLFEVEKIADSVLFLKNGKPQFNTVNEEKSSENHIIEIEITQSKKELESALSSIQVSKIQFNGGMYIITFSTTHSVEEVLQQIIVHRIKINYFRDISNSTKRLFI